MHTLQSPVLIIFINMNRAVWLVRLLSIDGKIFSDNFERCFDAHSESWLPAKSAIDWLYDYDSFPSKI